MALEPIKSVSGRGVYVAGDDIDTDRIIPARFMKCVTFDGLGALAFHDARFTPEGAKKEHSLNDPRFEGAAILLSNRNFGCGSSREHAPQALAKHGFKAVVAESFAEIFFGNSTTLGMPCVSLSHDEVVALAALLEESPETEVTIDVEGGVVRAAELCFSFTMKDAARDALLAGQWDPIGQLLESKDRVVEVADRLPYLRFE